MRFRCCDHTAKVLTTAASQHAQLECSARKAVPRDAERRTSAALTGATWSRGLSGPELLESDELLFNLPLPARPS